MTRIRTTRTAILALLALAAIAAGCGGSDGDTGASRIQEGTEAPPSQGVDRGAGSEEGAQRVSRGSERPQTPPDAFFLGESRPIEGIVQSAVGEGNEAAILLWRKGAAPPREVVVFLHGFLSQPPSNYASWLSHLARRGDTIVYPTYQAAVRGPETFHDAVLAGIRAGLDAVDADPASVVAIGHVTGGSLAFDYAAMAAEAGLPRPRGVLAVYPSRKPPSGDIPTSDLSLIDPATQLVAIAGRGSPLQDGEAQARALLRGATQVPPSKRRFIATPSKLLTPPPLARVAADRLIAVARSGSR